MPPTVRAGMRYPRRGPFSPETSSRACSFPVQRARPKRVPSWSYSAFRRTHHCFHEQTVAVYEEADLIEEWCEETDSDDFGASARQCLDWLRLDRDGTTYQEMLRNPLAHSTIRKALRQELKNRRSR